MNLPSGTRLGRYEVRALLGSGGMGEVYRAWDLDLEREVAIKVLRDEAGAGSDRARRFVQEAKATSGLHHPNIGHVYEIGSHDDLRFIAMEIVEGETLRQHMRRGTMPLATIVDIATQIAAALGAAHKAGIVHRDIKPENVIITPDGYAKVLDFGLAKLREIRGEDAATLVKTSPGTAMGTLAYMAPEQIAGGDVGPTADVFSLGVVLYEMVTARRPFDGTTSTDLASAILTKAPQPVHELRPDVPPKLASIIARSLAKNVDERFADGAEMFEELRSITREAPAPVPQRRGTLKYAIAVGVLALLVAGGTTVVRGQRRRDARQRIASAEKLADARRLAEAYEMALPAMAVLPADPRLRDVLTRTSGTMKVESDPPGAVVYLQRFKGPAQRVRIGVTPLTSPQLARAEYLLTLEKPGYAPGIRPTSLRPVFVKGDAFPLPVSVRMKLAEASKVPSGMVLVEGGEYRLSGYYRPSDRLVPLQDFFIDRTEVSNHEFEQFVRAGGYRRRELWQHPFVDGGRTLPFEQAMARFHDTTGLPGPRSWIGGAPPAGRENHPVADITWYEAAAFAAWKGKKLPTVHQWERAARGAPNTSVGNVLPWGLVQDGIDATERANFGGAGTMPVDTMPFGASPWGALHMAGNVSEWCRNTLAPGYAARGGAWKDAIYVFGQTAGFPAFYSAPTLGFRCVIGGGDEGDFPLKPEGYVPSYKPVDDRTFAEFRRRYDYARAPLQAQVVERVETPDWTREKITYVVAGKTVPAYLYLPKGFRRPLQVIYFAPAGDVTNGMRTLTQSIEAVIAPLIRGGRAIFSPVLEGFLGRPRPADWVAPDRGTTEYVDSMVGRVTEMRRGLDYLETRPDLDRSRMALLGISAGGGTGVYAAALESRFRSVVFLGTGLAKLEERYAPAASRVHFVPRITAPILLVQGRYDEDTSLRSETEPMFQLLRAPKRLVVFEGSHIPSQEFMIPTLTKWMDETMGAVGG